MFCRTGAERIGQGSKGNHIIQSSGEKSPREHTSRTQWDNSHYREDQLRILNRSSRPVYSAKGIDWC